MQGSPVQGEGLYSSGALVGLICTERSEFMCNFEVRGLEGLAVAILRLRIQVRRFLTFSSELGWRAEVGA